MQDDSAPIGRTLYEPIFWESRYRTESCMAGPRVFAGLVDAVGQGLHSCSHSAGLADPRHGEGGSRSVLLFCFSMNVTHMTNKNTLVRSLARCKELAKA